MEVASLFAAGISLSFSRINDAHPSHSRVSIHFNKLPTFQQQQQLRKIASTSE
jgi:hypothetical protein